MEQRERLIELIDEFIMTVDVKCWYSEELDEHLADYLLANGVIVPPCKVGDTVYIINRIYSGFRKAEVRAIYYTEDKKYYPKPHIIVQYDLARGRARVNFTDFGKTVFLTREEAEQKLQGE